jgi:hypothetical protein
VNCAEEDRREGDALEGVTPPTPCREFIDAFLSRVGVDARECWLMELGDRWRGTGLRGGSLPFGDAVELDRLNVRCGLGTLGEALCGEEGGAEAALMESRFNPFERASWFGYSWYFGTSSFVDSGNGAVSFPFCDGGNAIAPSSSNEPELHPFEREYLEYLLFTSMGDMTFD